jgi:uncharacterized protein YggE
MRLISPLLLAATLSLLPLAPALAETGSMLTVTGTGSVETTPDLATVSLGLTTNGATAGAAMSANTDALTAVIARLKATGIEDRDIQTSNLSLNPNWVMNASGTASEIQGYVATNMVTVRIRDLDQTGAVLDAAIADGANSLNGLTFGLQDPRPHQDAARRAAVADAVAIATLLSQAAGTKLGPILSIQEGAAFEPMPGPMYRTMADAAPVLVEAGSLDVSASVTLVFAIGE